MDEHHGEPVPPIDERETRDAKRETFMWSLKFSMSVSARCVDLCAAPQHD